jgi:IclR family mhp operon transcriptional activator
VNKVSMRMMESPYKGVRSLLRGLQLIEALSKFGSATPGKLSTSSGIDRATTYRLLNTLLHAGYVVQRREDGSYSLGPKLSRVANGIRKEDVIIDVVSQHMEELTSEVQWPSDFANLADGVLRIQASTHRLSPISIHRRLIGKTRPLLRTALGRAILAAMNREELDRTLAMVARKGGGDAAEIKDRRTVTRIVQNVRRVGYASAAGEAETKISAIALAVKHNRSVVGAVNIVFFRSAFGPTEAADRYLKRLRLCASRIESDLVSRLDGTE